jgi:hypothetical protein
MLCPTLPEAPSTEKPSESASPAPNAFQGPPGVSTVFQSAEETPSPAECAPSSDDPWTQLLDAARQTMQTTASAHERFLDLTQELTRTFAETVTLQTDLLKMGARITGDSSGQMRSPAAPIQRPAPSPPAFDRKMCMAFAIGSVGHVLGPAFEVVDTYRVRVRLPDEPLMLVDRIISVEGEMLSMASGRVVTEHDVLPGAWYLDGDRAPVCISVEAGRQTFF